MKTIQILGTGCPKCRKLTDAAVAAAAGLDVRIEKVEDLEKILAFGVLAVPAIVVDGVVKAAGRIPSADELRGYLT